MNCSLATGHIPVEFFPPPLYGELRSYLPPEARVSMLAIMLYAAGIKPWSWVLRESDWLLGHDPDVVLGQKIQYAADKAAHELALNTALNDAIAEAERMAQAGGRSLFVGTDRDGQSLWVGTDHETGERMFGDGEPAGDEMLVINPGLADDLRRLN